MLLRLFWSPKRNHELYIVSCAERVEQGGNGHAITAIRHAVQQEAAETQKAKSGDQLRFRLLFVQRREAALVREVVFLSDPFPAQPIADL
jgi:hypothetical protein